MKLADLKEGDFDGAISVAADMAARNELTSDYVTMLARTSGEPRRFFAELIDRKIEVQARKPPPGFDEP